MGASPNIINQTNGGPHYIAEIDLTRWFSCSVFIHAKDVRERMYERGCMEQI